MTDQKFTKEQVFYNDEAQILPLLDVYECRNCVFYKGLSIDGTIQQDAYTCQIVEGKINPNGSCILWFNLNIPFSWLLDKNEIEHFNSFYLSRIYAKS